MLCELIRRGNSWRAGDAAPMMDTRLVGVWIDPQGSVPGRVASTHITPGHDTLVIMIVESHRAARVTLQVANLELEEINRDTPLIGCNKFRRSCR